MHQYKLKILLEVIELKKSYWDKYKNTIYLEKNLEILTMIKKIFNENRKEIGYRIFTTKLKNEYNLNVNYKKVLRLMKENNIQAQYVRKMKKKIKWRKSFYAVNNYPDLINRNFRTITEKFKVLYTDVTYLI